MSETVDMIHSDGTRVSLHLPAPVGTAGAVFVALDELGFKFEKGEVNSVGIDISWHGGLDPDRLEEINEEIRDHVQPLIDAYQVSEKIRKRYRNGH